jgi:hypothetical protein
LRKEKNESKLEQTERRGHEKVHGRGRRGINYSLVVPDSLSPDSGFYLSPVSDVLKKFGR